MKNTIVTFLFTLLLCSCSEEPIEMLHTDEQPQTAKHLGVSIKNHLPRGSVFIDSTKEVFDFRSTRTFIKNDSVVPFHLSIKLPHEFIRLDQLQDEKYKLMVKTEMKYRVFVLPDSIVQFNVNQPSHELQSFIDKKSAGATELKKTIQPGETFTLSLGYLFKPSGGLTRAEIFTKHHKHQLSFPSNEKHFVDGDTEGLELKLGVNLNPPYYYSTLSVGLINYQK